MSEIQMLEQTSGNALAESELSADSPMPPSGAGEPGNAGTLVLDWDAELQQQVLRPATESEIADLEARRQARVDILVPPTVSRRQARQALLLAGKLALVQPAIDAIADPIQRGLLQIEWDDSQVFERHRPTLIALATTLGMSSPDIDALFVAASQL